MQLSNQRAQTIRDALVAEFGIHSDRLVIKGYGETQLRVSDSVIALAPTREENEILHLQNRRVEIRIIRL
jgi:outer membrane protein OmpA-like peptidoglycan-associated protein